MHQLSAMVLFVLVVASVPSSSDSAPNVCEQLRDSAHVGLLALSVVPDKKSFLLLTTNYYAYRTDIDRFTYPAYAGYPEYLSPPANSQWSIELSNGDLFDVLSPEERAQLKPDAHLEVSGFILHNQSMADYYVNREALSTAALEAFKERHQLDEHTPVFSFRRLGTAEPNEKLFYFNATLPKSFCVSPQEPSEVYELSVNGDGSRCYTRADLTSGKIDQMKKAKEDYQIRVATFSQNTSTSCANTTHLCGFLLNELFFALDNTARNLTVYQDVRLSNRTQIIATIPYRKFFRCSNVWRVLLYTATGLVIVTSLVVGGVLLLQMVHQWKRVRTSGRNSRNDCHNLRTSPELGKAVVKSATTHSGTASPKSKSGKVKIQIRQCKVLKSGRVSSHLPSKAAKSVSTASKVSSTAKSTDSGTK